MDVYKRQSAEMVLRSRMRSEDLMGWSPWICSSRTFSYVKGE